MGGMIGSRGGTEITPPETQSISAAFRGRKTSAEVMVELCSIIIFVKRAKYGLFVPIDTVGTGPEHEVFSATFPTGEAP
jgi:hypothetical protein